MGARYERMLDSLPASEPAILSAARSMELDGQTDRACELLEEAATRHPSPNLCKTLAALHLKQRRFTDCARAIAKVVEQDPSDMPSRLLLAEALIEGGNHTQALRTLARAEELGASCCTKARSSSREPTASCS
ncbi:MAG: tetratricopeptide repeat protein, partial [Persicimonas sp.]